RSPAVILSELAQACRTPPIPHLLRCRLRGIARVRRIYVNVQPRSRRLSWRIAVAILRIGLATGRCHLRPLRRLRKLPNVREPDAAPCRAGRGDGKYAARRPATLVVADEEANLAAACVLADVIRRNH